MPLYDYQCTDCEHREERFVKMDKVKEPQECPKCGGWMIKLVSAPAVRGDYAPYTCPITGKLVEGRRAHEENLKQHGCRVLEPGERETLNRRRAAEESQFEKGLDRTIDKFLVEAGPDKVAKLCNEVAAGASAEIVRL